MKQNTRMVWENNPTRVKYNFIKMKLLPSKNNTMKEMTSHINHIRNSIHRIYSLLAQVKCWGNGDFQIKVELRKIYTHLSFHPWNSKKQPSIILFYNKEQQQRRDTFHWIECELHSYPIMNMKLESVVVLINPYHLMITKIRNITN